MWAVLQVGEARSFLCSESIGGEGIAIAMEELAQGRLEGPSGAPLLVGFAGESVLRTVPISMSELDQFK